MIARPGPYINAETDGGGIPSWVLTSPNGYRSDTEPYLSAALQWFSEIDSIIAPHQITKGGDVILYQIENEYTGTSAADLQYMADLEQQATSDGIDVPFTFNQCCGSDTFTTGTGAVNISGQDNYPLGFDCADTSNFGQPYGYPSYAGEPIYIPEFQGGSFDGWGGSGYADCYSDDRPGLRERLLQEQHRPGRHHAEQLHGRGRDQLGLAAGSRRLHVLRLRRGDQRDRRDRHAGRPERHRRAPSTARTS